MKSQPTLFAELKESTVAMLMSKRQSADEPIDAVISRIVRSTTSNGNEPTAKAKSRTLPAKASIDVHKMHRAEVLGKILIAPTLGKLFSQIIDTMDSVAPDVLIRLSEMRARTRFHIAKTSADVHGGRTDLPAIQTRSGWWVSANIGKVDLERGLQGLCDAGDLQLGRDIVFKPIVNSS